MELFLTLFLVLLCLVVWQSIGFMVSFVIATTKTPEEFARDYKKNRPILVYGMPFYYLFSKKYRELIKQGDKEFIEYLEEKKGLDLNV